MGYISEIRKKVGHDAIFMPGPAGSIIKENKILLQKRTDDGNWSLHGGAMEFGETLEEALEREVKEEINIKPINPEFIKIYSGKNYHFFYPNKDEVYTVVALYLISEYEGDLKADQDEVSELKWFDIDSLPENLHKPDIELINDSIEYYKKMIKSY